MRPSSMKYLVVGVVFAEALYFLAVKEMQPRVWVDGPLKLGWIKGPNEPFIVLPKPTKGCFPHRQTPVPGITLHCSADVEMTANLSHAAKRENFYRVLLRKNADCWDSELLGNPKDGGWYACKAKPFLFKKPCLVYSFGINNDWSFDDAISTKYGCEVHSFDPSMGKEDHKHSDLVYFYSIGLDGKNKTVNVDGNDWKMRTFCTLLKDLGHTERTIDYLKFDIEFSEWAAIIAMLEEGCLDKVKQLSFEGHAWGDTDSNYTLFWRGMHGLENAGFLKWRVLNRHWRCFHPTDAPKETWCPQADMNYINAKYLKR